MTIMFYIALILVAAGLGLILYSLFMESGRKYTLPVRDRFIPNYDLPESKGHTPVSRGAGESAMRDEAEDDFLSLDDDQPVSIREKPRGDEPFAIYEEPRVVEFDEDSTSGHTGILEELDGEFSREHARETASPDKIADNTKEIEEAVIDSPPVHTAYLYEDSSQIIDYEQDTNVIDPTMGQYKRLKRIGKGTVQVIKDGISFVVGKNLFRFDFYKVDKAKIGENFVALFLKGGSTVRLLIFDQNSPAWAEVKKGIESHFSAS
jgi:hypothetical protein